MTSHYLNIVTPDSTLTPDYAHPGDAGADLRSAEFGSILPGERKFFHTGVSIALPEGFVGYVMSRSGMARKSGVFVLNAPGVVDSGYRGEIGVTLYNSDPFDSFKVGVGDRIAQLVIQRVERFEFVRVDALDETPRGKGGFGSTDELAKFREKHIDPMKTQMGRKLDGPTRILFGDGPLEGEE